MLPAIYSPVHQANVIPFEPEVVRLTRVPNSYGTREEWLHGAIRMLRPMFKQHGYDIPEQVRVAIGWTSTGRKSRAIGEAWCPTVSADKHAEIFIKVTLDCPVRILDVLVHELIHVTVGLKEKHGGEFKRLALLLGLEGKMTATTASERLRAALEAIAGDLGPFPHAPITSLDNGKKKQTTRLLKASCNCTGEDYIVRITRKALDNSGAPICPDCMERMKVAGESEEGEE